MVFLSAVLVLIADTLHHRVDLTGHSGMSGNALIVSHTSVIYTTLPAVSVFITSIALRPPARRIKEKTLWLLRKCTVQ